MSRDQLPQNYIKTAGTVLEGFEDSTDWSVAYGVSGSWENNTVIYKTGTQSIKVTTTGGGYVSVSKILGSAVNLKNLKTISLDVYVETQQDGITNTFNYVVLRLLNNEGGTSYMSIQSHVDGPYTRPTYGWSRLIFHRDDFSSTGGGSFDDDIVGIKLILYPISGKAYTIYLDNLKYNEERLVRCVLAFAEDRISTYDEGFSILSSKGLVGTSYICVDQIGLEDFMSLANIQEMYAAGWTIGNRTQSNDALPGKTLAAQESQIESCTNYLIDNGMSRGAYNLFLPLLGGDGSGYDTNTFTALENQDILTAMAPTFIGFALGGVNNYTFNIKDINRNVTLASAKGWVDIAIKYQLNLFLIFHLLDEEEGDPVAWAVTKFTSLINYIVARKIKCITIDEWYTGLTNPRISIP